MVASRRQVQERRAHLVLDGTAQILELRAPALDQRVGFEHRRAAQSPESSLVGMSGNQRPEHPLVFLRRRRDLQLHQQLGSQSKL